jgi:cell wall-associated NlpC family hydrolase
MSSPSLSRVLLRIAVIGACVALGAGAGCTAAPSPRADAAAGRSVEPRPDAAGARIARLAMHLIGTPYRYGGTTPEEGFDCSGLVFYTYAKTGLDVPRTSTGLFRRARKIALGQAGQGDLVFFQDQAKLSHVGIYLGDSLFIHAPSSGSTVSVASLDTPYYQQHLVAVGRLLPP